MSFSNHLSNHLSTLLLDIKILIAGLHPAVWYHLYRYDPEFSKYAKTFAGIRQYKLCYNKPIVWSNGTQV